MGLFQSSDAGNAEIARLEAELEKANRRLEEVAAYYRGELESARQRAESESVRSQAHEVARRKRAEEQVAYLKGELEAARSEAENSGRRHQELLQGLSDLEQESERQTREEVDRFREAAKAAWRTAEDEVARLDAELHALQRQLERYREERRQLERTLEQQEENRLVILADHQRMVSRLKWALKQSEERRHRAERAVKELHSRSLKAAGESRLAHGAGNPVEVEGLEKIKLGADEDAEGSWEAVRIAGGEEFSDEFLMLAADESLNGRITAQAAGIATATRPGSAVAEAPRPSRPAPPEEVSDEEAEELIMELNVDERMDRIARSSSPSRPTLTPPATEGSYAGYWKWAAVVAAVAVVGVAAAWFI